MRGYEYARKLENGEVLTDSKGVELKMYLDARLPEYQTKYSAGADFFSAEEVVIEPVWKGILAMVCSCLKKKGEVNESYFKPTMVHTGVKACMNDDEVLELYNRSSNPIKRGLVLSNGVGVVDADYYGNGTNDGEISFAFYNFLPFPVTIKVGERIGQGVFKKVLYADFGAEKKDVTRKGGYGSTSK